MGWPRRRRADPLASLKQGPAVDKSVHPEGRTAGVVQGEVETCISRPDPKNLTSINTRYFVSLLWLQ